MKNYSYSTMFKKESKLLFQSMFCVGIIFDLVLATQNLLCLERCENNTPSILFGPCFVFFFQFGVILYFFIVLKFLRGCNGYISPSIVIDAKKFGNRICFLASMAFCIPPVSLCLCSLALIGIQVAQYQESFIKIYVIGSGILALMYGLLITYAFRFVLKYLEEHIVNFEQSSIEIQSVYKRLKRAYHVCGSISALVGTLCLSFGLSDYLWNRSHYVFTCIRIILPLCGTVLIIEPSRTIKRHTVTTGYGQGAENPVSVSPRASYEITAVSSDFKTFSLQPESREIIPI